MTDEPSSLSQRAEARAAAKARRAKRIERREACLELVVSGYSHPQIATALKISLATVRRAVDKAPAERPIHAPQRYAALQVERLTREFAERSPSPALLSSTGEGGAKRRMGCGPLLRRKSDCTTVTANLHRTIPAFRIRPSAPSSPLPEKGSHAAASRPRSRRAWPLAARIKSCTIRRPRR
jgi:Homeodomain-like domain